MLAFAMQINSEDVAKPLDITRCQAGGRTDISIRLSEFALNGVGQEGHGGNL
jgi:hypothetical protein